MPTGALINTALFDHCPEVVAACVARGDEIIAHGHTNAERQGDWPEARERALLAHCRERIARADGPAPAGWLSPWISESATTPDLLAEEGYALHAQLVPRRPADAHAHAQRPPLWSVPYPQEINDIPMIVRRQMDADAFARMIVDHFDEMLRAVARRSRWSWASRCIRISSASRTGCATCGGRSSTSRARATRGAHLDHHARAMRRICPDVT